MSDIARISVLEDRQKRTDERLEKVENILPTIDRLNLLMEMQIEQNKKQNETLEKMNTNLTNLNNASKSQSERINNIEEKLSNDKELFPQLHQLTNQIDDFDERIVSLESRKIDLNKIFHDKLTWFIGALFLAALYFIFKYMTGIDL